MLLGSWMLALLAQSPEPAAQADAPEHRAARTALAQVESWPELIARDARVSFGLRTQSSALASLARADASDASKAIALIALGAARVPGERPRIESWAQEGPGEVRQAAVLALGETKTGDVALLIEMTAKKSQAIAECALLALVRHGSPSGLAYVQGVAADLTHPLAERARQILAFGSDPLGTPDLDVAARLFELRFAAARAHGLVDGQAWDVLVLDDLCTDQKFLNRVIYRAASGLRRAGVRDHFFEIALEKGAPERLRGVVNAIPAELSQMIESGAFTPADEREWNALLSEIEARGLEGFTDPILRRAFLVPGLRAWTSTLLARGGSEGSLSLLEIGLESEDEAERAACVWGLGETDRSEYLPSINALAEDPSPRVRAAVAVAKVRLGSEQALRELRDRLELDRPEGVKPDPDPEWAELVEALSRSARDRRVREVLIELMPKLATQARAKVATALLEVGYTDMRSEVRAHLLQARPGGVFGARCVAALAGGAPGLDDLQALRDLFPAEDDLELNVELACALLRLHDAEILPVARTALWSEPWNRSVLTGALWIEAAGIDALRLEVQHPPVGASQRDQRRVGFALGEWGGVDQVDWLAERLPVDSAVLQGAVLGALGARTH